MKATFEIPDELYRAVKAETAREGRTLREVAIGLFERWLRERSRGSASAPAVDWRNYTAPLAAWMPDDVTDHSPSSMRASIESRWDEPV